MNPSAIVDAPGASANSRDVALKATQSQTRPSIQSLFFGSLVWIYIIGIAVGLLRLTLHHVLARKLVSSSCDIGESEMSASVRECLLCCNSSHRVLVRLSNQVGVPLVTGLLYPNVLLPNKALDWSPGQLRSALIHEIAHIFERHDLLVQLFCNLTVLLYWPQPLVWLLAEKIRVERELACDDRALLDCTQPTQYARHLLDVATGLDQCKGGNTAALTMARNSNVESRIIAVLQSTRIRAPLNCLARFRLAAPLIALSLLVAYLSPFSATSDSEASAQESTENTTEQSNQDTNASDAAQADLKAQHVFQGRVLLPNGDPAHSATITRLGTGVSHPPIELETDERGRFTLRLDARSYHTPLVVRTASKELMGYAELAVDSESWESPLAVTIADIVLKPPKTFVVKVVDVSGAPVSEAAVVTQAGYGQLQRVLTDAGGRAELTYPNGLQLRSLGAVKPGKGCDYRVFEDVADQLAQIESKIALMLNGIREARVKVIGPDGNPLPNIPVHPTLIRKPKINGYWQPSASEFYRETNETGIADFDVVPIDQVRGVQFSVSLPRDDWFYVGESSSGQPYIEWGGEPSTTVRVYEKVLVGGHIRHPDGRPAAGIRIAIAGSTRYSGLYYDHSTSDADGNWSALVKPNGYYLFAIRAKEYAAPAQEGIFVFETDTPKDLNFTLEPPRRIFGRVVGPIDDRTYIRLYQRGPDYYRLPPGPRLPDPPPGLGGRAVSMVIEDYQKVEPDGSFEFLVGPGDYAIEGPDRKQQQFDIVDEMEMEFNFQLEGPLRVSTQMRVVLASKPEEPVAYAQIVGRSFPDNTRGSFRKRSRMLMEKWDIERDTVNCRVLVESTDKRLAGYLELGPNENSISIAVKPTITVVGRIRDRDGRPIANASLDYGIELAYPNGGFSMITTTESVTDANGRFELRNLSDSVEHTIRLINEKDAQGRARGWSPITYVTPRESATLKLGDIQLPARSRRPGTSIEDVVTEAFKSEETLQQRYTRTSREAREADQQLVIVAGSPDLASSLSLYEAIESNEVYQAFARYRRLPVDVLGESSKLNYAFLETLTGQSIDPNKTTLLVLDTDRQLLAHTTIEALSGPGESLQQALIKFLSAAAQESLNGKPENADQ
ncbi:MAG: M56 family metallopeptidase [Pirellulaceae bacterium]